MHAIFASISDSLGLGLQPGQLTFLQITLRGAIVFVASLIMVRLSDRRALTKKSPFDQLLIVILASVLARAINGSASFFETLGGAAVIFFLHRVFAWASCRWPSISRLLRGQPYVLIRNGKLEKEAMRKNSVPLEAVLEDLRLSAKLEEIEKVKIARLEASGNISFILRESKA